MPIGVWWSGAIIRVSSWLIGLNGSIESTELKTEWISMASEMPGSVSSERYVLLREGLFGHLGQRDRRKGLWAAP